MSPGFFKFLCGCDIQVYLLFRNSGLGIINIKRNIIISKTVLFKELATSTNSIFNEPFKC